MDTEGKTTPGPQENLLFSLMIASYADRLERELDLLSDALPADLERHQVRVYTGSGPMPALDFNPAHWTTQAGYPLLLDGLLSLLEAMRAAAETLESGERT